MLYAAGVDIGATSLKVGIVDGEGRILSRAKMETNAPIKALELASGIWKLIQQALESGEIPLSQLSRIGAGCPGTVNPRNGILQYACNLELADTPWNTQLVSIQSPHLQWGVSYKLS